MVHRMKTQKGIRGLQKKNFFVCIFLIMILVLSACGKKNNNEVAQNVAINNETVKKIDELVYSVLKKSKVPAASICIVDHDDTLYRSYVSSNKSHEQDITEDSLFELGSMSKAMTGLAILYLEQQGKLNLDDNVKEYLPWFHVKYDGIYRAVRINKEVDLTISNLLHHTSGIPTESISKIPVGQSDDMLEKTIRNINGIKLDYYPGTRYQYATINYDILGLIIEKISNQSYESFISDYILQPLGLNSTYMFQEEAAMTGNLVDGYKMQFFKPIVYDAPRYRGNTPAGYIISCTKDMERWIRIQMGMIEEVPDEYKKIVNQSHIGDTTVNCDGGFYYGAGWRISSMGAGDQISHGGNNPNFSSTIVLRPNDKQGICILSNMNSNAAAYLGDTILDIVYGKSLEYTAKYKRDTYINLDLFFSIICILSSIFIVTLMIMFAKVFIEIKRGIRVREKVKELKIAGIMLLVPIIIFMGFCFYYLPNVLFDRYVWSAVNVWGSLTIKYGCILGYIALALFFIFVILTFNYQKKDEKNYFTLIILSLINGVASALIIYTINESFNRNLNYSKELLVYFIFSIVLFIYTIKLLQGKLIIVTNDLAYQKRMSIIHNILNTSFQSVESIGRDRISCGLITDCIAVSQIPEIIVNFFSNALTLIFCLFYLMSKSFYAFIASVLIIILNGIVSGITSKKASVYWEKNRSMQDIFFGQINDLINGFKELILNRLREKAFKSEIDEYAKLSADLNKSASIKFLNFSLYNTLTYNLVFGIVVFLFPLLIYNVDVNQLRENLFIVFYMIGPVGALTSAIPRLVSVNVNLKRIDSLIYDLNVVATEQPLLEMKNNEIDHEKENQYSIKYENITFTYKRKDEEDEETEREFTLGPISFELKSGEITYITGGNGTGKSTLGKLITGLYRPDSGKISINGEEVSDFRKLNDLFSSVYTDYVLFKKLYGIDYISKKDEIENLLEELKLNKVVHVEEGSYSSVNLSSGQKKRLALVTACLEGKPVMILDEWAAEQDPTFKKYFYEEFLEQQKEKGKALVVITHDDRYFHLADKLMKLENGMLEVN